MIERPVKAIPDGMHSLTPYLICRDAAASVAFYKTAFGATHVSRVANESGAILNAQLKIGDSLLMVMDDFPEYGALSPASLKGSPVTIHLQVEDVDEVIRRATAAGATVKMPVREEFWGDRRGVIEDPFGHNWAIATHVRDVAMHDKEASAKKAMQT